VSGQHSRERWGYAAFFLVAAALQGFYGLLLFGQPWRYDACGGYDPEHGERAARAMYLAGVAGNALLVLLYAITRTLGVPLLGPEANALESVDLVGVVTKLTELSCVGCLVALLRLDRRPGDAGDPA
jgi:hypothetical protein